MRFRILRIATAALVVSLVSQADAASRRHRHTAMQTMHAPAPQAPTATPFSFYPQQVEGGVTGNLSFNNQIRKHTDPLNANGAR